MIENIPNTHVYKISEQLRVRIFQVGMYRCPPEERPYQVYLTGHINTHDIHVKLGEFYLQYDNVADNDYSTMYNKEYFEDSEQDRLFNQIALRAIGSNKNYGNPYEEMYK